MFIVFFIFFFLNSKKDSPVDESKDSKRMPSNVHIIELNEQYDIYLTSNENNEVSPNSFNKMSIMNHKTNNETDILESDRKLAFYPLNPHDIDNFEVEAHEMFLHEKMNEFSWENKNDLKGMEYKQNDKRYFLVFKYVLKENEIGQTIMDAEKGY